MIFLICYFFNSESDTRGIPSKILRLCKEQLYELVQSCETDKKICVVDVEKVDTKKDIEFVVGVGVAAEKKKSILEIGYTSIKSVDIFSDLLYQDRNYDPQLILNSVISDIGKNITYLPLFHYLRKLEITDSSSYNKSGFNLEKWIVTDVKKLQEKNYRKNFDKNCNNKGINEIIKDYLPEKAAKYIPFLAIEDIDLDVLRDFLVKNKGHYISDQSSYATSFRKIACLYDKLKYGW